LTLVAGTRHGPGVTIQLYLAFVAAAALLIVIPGPNVALVVATSVAHGPRQGLATVAGTSAAIAIQLALVSLGLAQILGGLGALFDWLRWAGAGYLLWLGVRAWRAPPEDLSIIRPQTGSLGRRFARGLLVSLTNRDLLQHVERYRVVSRDLGKLAVEHELHVAAGEWVCDHRHQIGYVIIGRRMLDAAPPGDSHQELETVVMDQLTHAGRVLTTRLAQ